MELKISCYSNDQIQSVGGVVTILSVLCEQCVKSLGVTASGFDFLFARALVHRGDFRNVKLWKAVIWTTHFEVDMKSLTLQMSLLFICFMKECCEKALKHSSRRIVIYQWFPYMPLLFNVRQTMWPTNTFWRGSNPIYPFTPWHSSQVCMYRAFSGKWLFALGFLRLMIYA